MKLKSIASLASLAGLLLAARVAAGPQFAEERCPRSGYSKLHYWTPTLVRWWEKLRRTSVSCNTPSLYPEIEGEVRILQYPCQAVEPADIRYAISPPPRAVIPVVPYGTIPPTGPVLPSID